MSDEKIQKSKVDKKPVIQLKQKSMSVRISPTEARMARPISRRARHDSLNAIGDLVQCGICLNQLSNPRMLPCQHTFCLGCLKAHLTARNLTTQAQNGGDSPNLALKRSQSLESKITCIVCGKEYPMSNGHDSLDELPKNMHVESLLKILQDKISEKKDENKEDHKCFRCRKELDEKDKKNCEHCDQNFCSDCWKSHLDTLDSNLGDLIRQIEDSESRLVRKIEDYEIRCDRNEETIKEVIQQKIMELEKIEKNSLREVASMKREANVIYEALEARLKFLKKKIESNTFNEGNEVQAYLQLQKDVSKVLNEVKFFAEARMGFNPDSLRLEQHDEQIYNIEEAKKTVVKLNPFESLETMVKFFKTKKSKAQVIWNKCPRPGGLGIPPWDHSLLLVSAPDARCVFLLERSRLRLVRRLNDDTLLTPTGICFCSTRRVTYVADARNHTIHMFGEDWSHLGAIGGGVLRAPHGVAIYAATNELAVCDTAHDRVVLMDAMMGTVRLTLSNLKRPEGVVVTANGRVVVADTGNDCVKIFEGKNGRLLHSVQIPRPSAVGIGPFDVIGTCGASDCPFLMTSEGAPIEMRNQKRSKDDNVLSRASGFIITPELDILISDVLARKLIIF